MQDSWPTLVADEANRFKPFPLTPIQEAYWIGRTAAFELGRTGIHIYEELECDNLDCHRLRHAWQRVLDTHDALRTIVQEDGQQRALPSASYEVEWVDLRSHESRIQEQYLQQLRDTLSHKVYRPESWPLFDIVYVELSSGHGVLFISIDALHVDMSGFRHVFADWVECYRDPDWNFGHPGLRYRDYALALKALENSDVYRASWEFWCREASLLPPAPDLPYKKSFASVERQRFGRCQVRLPSDSWNSLKRRASSAGLTPTAALLTAYAEVLALWSASEEFTINVTAFNALPLHEDVTDLVGDFTSLVLLAVSLEPDLTFEDRARDLQRRLSERLLHRAVSGVHVLSEFARQNAIEAGRAAMPVVFTSTLNPQTRGLTSLGALGRRRYSIIQTPQVALDLQVSEDAGDLIVHWDYVEELISEPLAREMSGAFETLLAGLSAGVAWRERVPVRIPPAQRKRRQQVNLTEKPFPAGALADLMWPENRRIANEPAVVAGSRSIAYRDLYALASRLAQGLRAAGLRREDRVAVLLPKGVEQIIAVHAIVMAGGAYVPVDLLWPEQRQKHVAELAQFRFAVTNRDHKDAVAAMAFLRSSRLVCVDEEFPPPMAEHEPAGPDSLAYVLFTSGSTGIPKGVQIEHRSVVNRIFDVAGRFSLTSRDRLFGVTALHHDLSVFDLFGAAMTGATLVLPDAGRLRDPDHWARLLSDERVTVWNSVPAFFEMLLEYLERPEARERLPKSLRLILLSGDWIPVDLPWRLGALLPDAQLVALGGPTETTVWDICNPGAEIAPAGRSILYGRPMANAKYYVLDRNLREKPDWTPGELCIGGAGLSRGFLGDAQLTSTRFVAHPVTGERLYRSGDAGRFLPDGNIEILGRLDSQIKIAGQRMEAGEIEAVLCGDPAVREARVRVRRTPSGSVRLVANVVPRVMPQANAPDPGEVEAIEFKLRRHGLLDTEGCDFRVPLRPSGKAAGEEQFLSRRSHRHFDSSPVPFARLSG